MSKDTRKKKLNTRLIRNYKRHNGQQSPGKNACGRNYLQMLTCYDYQTAQLLDELEQLDLILVGDSLGNVILGYETTVEVTLEEMVVFGAAVKRGAANTFTIVDLPFATYPSIARGIECACRLFQKTKAEALKLEGAEEYKLKLITRLTQIGIPIMGHIGLTPQSVHEQGGYYVHGLSERDGERLLRSAVQLEEAGVFAMVLECIDEQVAAKITANVGIPTIGIGSGAEVDGQVLVTNDLLKMGPARPPKFCTPVTDLYELRKNLIKEYLQRTPGPGVIRSE
ncbi:MAG: 3-methyl-2-oxobutanoate hydroxymethyltransferase [Oligoflexia bacterium]|nr:3-methyl-2-oxobutanoate hydroxymethyltransferase [Oligoflexia bacterium]